MSYPPASWPPSQPLKKKRSPLLVAALVGVGAIALFVVLAIVVTLAIGAATPSDEEKADRTADRSTAIVEQRTDQALVLGTAEDLCSELMERRFGDAEFSGWEITAELAPDEWSNPRWRVFGQMSTPVGIPRGFYCDITWQKAADRYVAELVS
ncbi:hypothetical protein [uncultured Gordonia sp.]|uniref:hypothetical protein n=1 Tax=uncultured Gordonia sp. TaxID=198437 RepID=UPI00258F8BA8|nr:hypothetical protein [uncultured Gordonia sp.]